MCVACGETKAGGCCQKDQDTSLSPLDVGSLCPLEPQFIRLNKGDKVAALAVKSEIGERM